MGETTGFGAFFTTRRTVHLGENNVSTKKRFLVLLLLHEPLIPLLYALSILFFFPLAAKLKLQSCTDLSVHIPAKTVCNPICRIGDVAVLP